MSLPFCHTKCFHGSPHGIRVLAHESAAGDAMGLVLVSQGSSMGLHARRWILPWVSHGIALLPWVSHGFKLQRGGARVNRDAWRLSDQVPRECPISKGRDLDVDKIPS